MTMNLDELRAGLDRAADTLHDTGAVGRTADVHQRIGRVRRRRQAIAAAGAAAVIAVVGTVVGVTNGDTDKSVPPANPTTYGPTPPTVAGLKVEPWDSDMADWDYVLGLESDPGDETLIMNLPADDHARVVTFTTDLGSAVTLTVDGKLLRREDGFGTASYPQAVGPGKHTIVLTALKPDADSRLGMAVHRRPSLDLPTLPVKVGDYTLVSTAYGEDGGLDKSFVLPKEPFAFAVQCWSQGLAGEGRVAFYGHSDEYYGNSCLQYPPDEIGMADGNLFEVTQKQLDRWGIERDTNVSVEVRVGNYFAERDDAYARRMQAVFKSLEPGMVFGLYIKE